LQFVSWWAIATLRKSDALANAGVNQAEKSSTEDPVLKVQYWGSSRRLLETSTRVLETSTRVLESSTRVVAH